MEMNLVDGTYLFSGWEIPVVMLKAELDQKLYEGAVIPHNLQTEIQACKDDTNDELVVALHKKLNLCQRDPNFQFSNAYTLKEIHRERPEGKRKLTISLTESEMAERIQKAWIGRTHGCALGKPVEIMGMAGWNGKNGRGAIKQYLIDHDAWPLENYIPTPRSEQDTANIICLDSTREKISYIEADDDIHYTLVGLTVMEQKGLAFNWTDIAQCWNSSLPYNMICTAETQAIMNFNMVRPRLDPDRRYPTAEFTSSFNNPYREWIGAQIRADFFGYAVPGQPQLAAELAWRDAHWTHRANGIYGEMFIAACIAAAFVYDDPMLIIETGLSEIPAKSQLAIAIKNSLQWYKKCASFEEFSVLIEETFPQMCPVHTVNNALIVIMALLYGAGDMHKTMEIAVMGGLDTDCNGATAGSIAGAAGWTIPNETYTKPTGGRVKVAMIGFSDTSIDELVARTMAVQSKIH